LSLCQLPPATDIGLPMLPPPCAITGREQVQQNAPQNARLNLLNDLVGARKQRRRHVEAERPRGLEVDR
jgi:hypothetical protein